MAEPVVTDGFWRRPRAAATHLLVGVAVGLAAGVIVGPLVDQWLVAAISGWVCGVVAALAWTWAVVWPLDGATTQAHSQREDPSRPATDVVLLATAVASLLAVALVMFSDSATGVGEAALGVVSIAASWGAVHTVFVLRYARLYYDEGVGGIDFPGTDRPTYRDFAYVAFTIGMTFQVSDTTVRGTTLRSTVLRHALLSYLFGAVVIAVVINLLAGLGARAT